MRALLRLAAELGIERPPGVAERADIVAFILASGRVDLADDDDGERGGAPAAPAARGAVVRSEDAAGEAKASGSPRGAPPGAGADDAAGEAKPSTPPSASPRDDFARTRGAVDPQAEVAAGGGAAAGETAAGAAADASASGDR